MTQTDGSRDIRVVAPALGLALLQGVVTGLVLLIAFWDAFSQIDCAECFPTVQAARWVLTGALILGWGITLAGLVTGYIRQRPSSWAPAAGSAVIVVGYLLFRSIVYAA
ncbi:type VI protein secretion system component VasK [Microbacterium sp. SORGH_AS428]|uniref:hypothetical protein n=1 Tax=Microbacterium sp. SORGH_AS_0428 TaxID=3041788 RepID=UPI00285D5D0C|nr:hypothetical protein [Microbacterium sp. SORGH_AS_0428]MDR6200014.1 type VI protein secretion system component VasK [Microbacterium sp. SORGH_AS_0428]